MAIFLGAQDEDILAWRGVAELAAELRGMTAASIAGSLNDDAAHLLRGFRERLDSEIALEERFATEFGWALEKLEHATFEDEFSHLLPRFSQLTQDYFNLRGSVAAVHSFCNAFRDGLVRKTMNWAENALELEEMRKPPAPYCWFTSGSAGRLEQTFCVDPSYFLIHGEGEDEVSAYFEKFAYRAAALLGKIGLLPDGGGAAMLKNIWRGGRKEWRKDNLDRLKPGNEKGLSVLLGRADLRLIHGDAVLADEMLNVVRSMIEFRQGELIDTATGAATASRTRAALFYPAPGLRDLGKSIAEIPSGLDFFGRLKVEKGGRNRGKFDVEQYARAPLIKNVRLLAIEYGLAETATVARIKGLQAAGHLSVDLSDRLLRAYHEFTRLKLIRQIREGCENEKTCFIDPRELGEAGEKRLRTGLDAVSDLEKITYLSFTEQG